jgi:hypothetical protein
MGSPITPPRFVTDAEGHLRMKLKRGTGHERAEEGPHVHYFSRTGVRLGRDGSRVDARSRDNFRPIKWDLPEQAPARASGPPNVEAALDVARRSPTFRRLLDETLRSGWGIELGNAAFGSGCRKGPHTIALDSRRSTFVARMIHHVALACALAEPLPSLDPAHPSFVREATVFLMRRDGHAALHQAIVRDEILLAGGPDIGGPGLRGLQLEAYDVHRRERVAIERAVDAVALSIDGEHADGFTPETGPRLARNVRAAFVAPSTVVSAGLTSEMVQAFERLRHIPAQPHPIGRAFGVELAPRPLAIQTPYLDVHAALLPEGPFSWVEVRAPSASTTPTNTTRTASAARRAARVILVPRYVMSHFDLFAWFGPGAPHHVDLLGTPLATAAYPFEQRQMYVTYRADDERMIASFTIAEG